jgi:uncharacterized protein YecE (DUF72 family)
MLDHGVDEYGGPDRIRRGERAYVHHALSRAYNRRQMTNRVHSDQCTTGNFRILEIADDKFGFPIQKGRPALPRTMALHRKVVQDANVVTRIHQFIRYVGTDEPRSTRYKYRLFHEVNRFALGVPRVSSIVCRWFCVQMWVYGVILVPRPSRPAPLWYHRCTTGLVAQAFIGTSGWNYKHWWGGVFYAQELKPPQWLPFFAQHFDTVEINNSFYRLPSESAFERWREQVPKHFVFAVKASRFLTHIKRLKDPEEPLDLFFSRARLLGPAIGPVLFQLPPQFKADLERLEIFLTALRAHAFGRRIRAVIEVRDPSWLVAPVFDLLRRFNTALCFADWKEMPVADPITADFIYVRRHSGKAGNGNYGRSELNADVKRIQEWLRRNLDVYVYFNNDWEGYALKNARYVKARL